MLALSGLAAESMVQDVGWTMMDIGKRIERGLALTALLRATLTTVRSPGAEQTITESTLVACESSVIYRRRNLGAVSIAAVADLVLFDAENPRSLVYQLERLRADLQGAARLVGLVAARAAGRRDRHPAAPARPGRPRGGHADGTRARAAPSCSTGCTADLRDLSGVITATHLSLPGGMQPLWGPDRAPGDAVTAFPTGRRLGIEPVLPGDSPHGVRVLRRRDQLLRPRLPHAARHRPAALPVARTADRSRSRPTAPPAGTPTATSARTSTSPSGTAGSAVTSESVVEVDPPPPELYGAGSAAGAVGDRPSGRPGRCAGHASSPWTCSRRRSPTRYGTTPPRASTPGRPLIEVLQRPHVADLLATSPTDPGRRRSPPRSARCWRRGKGYVRTSPGWRSPACAPTALAASYVSGYLATDPPPGKERMVGIDATHAWASVWTPQNQWLGLDPTNDQMVDERYIIVGWGRDYADVPPLRGIIYTDSESSVIDVAVDVAPFEGGVLHA